MKKAFALLLALAVLAAALTGCAAKKTAEPTELIIFAAASLTETLTQLGSDYMADHPEVHIVFNFDSSGTLKTQIEEGAACDVFLSAGQKQMDQLEELGLVSSDTRFDILENKVTLAVPQGNPGGIISYDWLAETLRDGEVLLAMGNADVPVGQYTQKIFAYYGLDEAALAEAGVLTYGSNVKEVTTQISEAAVSCGIIYQTDAHSAGLTVVDTATAEMCGQVIYPAALAKAATQPQAAADFLAYLRGDHADGVFAAVGFTPIG